MKNKILVLSVLTALNLMAGTHVNAQTTSALQQSMVKKTTIKIAHGETDNSAKHRTLVRLKEEMEKKFPNRVVFDIQENNKLYTEKQVLEALELGTINLALPTLTQISTDYSVPELQLFDLPYLFNNKTEVSNFLQSPLSGKLMDFFNKKNNKIQALAIWPADFKLYSANSPLRNPNDFRNHNFRAESNDISKKTLEALGAKNIKVASLSEFNESLEKKNDLKLTASEQTLSEYMFKEVFKNNNQKTITLSNHGFTAFGFVANKRWLNSLPEDIRTELLTLSKTLAFGHLDLSMNISASLLGIAKDNGVNIYQLTQEEQENFRKSVVLSHQHYLEKINKEFLLEVYQSKRSR